MRNIFYDTAVYYTKIYLHVLRTVLYHVPYTVRYDTHTISRRYLKELEKGEFKNSETDSILSNEV